jgi:hypothetical protein
MKRISAIILILALMFSLAACESGNKNDTNRAVWNQNPSVVTDNATGGVTPNQPTAQQKLIVQTWIPGKAVYAYTDVRIACDLSPG